MRKIGLVLMVVALAALTASSAFAAFSGNCALNGDGTCTNLNAACTRNSTPGTCKAGNIDKLCMCDIGNGVPGMSQWGVIGLSVLLLGSGAMFLVRRRGTNNLVA